MLVDGIGFTELALVLVALAYVTERSLDALGWSRSSRTLRRENEDLVRRNGELEGTVHRLDEEIARLKAELDVLTPQVAELQKRDQAAVLAAISEHERTAGLRHEKTYGVLTEIRDALRQSTKEER
jgi:predicted  nucleic acid-binding Zn-ribbon protein